LFKSEVWKLRDIKRGKGNCLLCLGEKMFNIYSGAVQKQESGEWNLSVKRLHVNVELAHGTYKLHK
jgi:hypothetical protein